MKQNSLVVYSTHSTNTRKIAEIISEKTEGKLFEILPTEPYPDGYDDVVKQAKKEIGAGYRPDLATDIDVAPYDVIYVGTPNWWSTMAPPVATFLASHDFAGKTVVPFCTHGGGGMAHIQRDMKKLAKGAKVPSGFDLYGNGGSRAEAEVEGWLKEVENDL